MDIEEKIKSSIRELSRFIKKADESSFDNKRCAFIWKKQDCSQMFGDSDSFDYFWLHCGEQKRYIGKLEASKELLKEVKNGQSKYRG